MRNIAKEQLAPQHQHSWPDAEFRTELKVAAKPASMRVASLYEAKTDAILRRYGPGPRVHYHTGFVDDLTLSTSPAALRAQLFESQERMLKYASISWKLGSIDFREVLDVGCGLGGTAILWAQEFGAHVTAITIAPSHIALISEFARRAGVESLVTPLLCDASAVLGERCYDAALAIESSSLFPRRPWFRCLSKLLRSKGRVFVFDCFLQRREYEEAFNRHWCAQIGTAEEYVTAAREQGFRLEAIEDTSLRTATFWTTTCALIRAEAKESRPDKSQLRAIEESLETHESMRRGLLDGGLRQLNMTFIKQ
jgi:tocopherol O-methyltransferase